MKLQKTLEIVSKEIYGWRKQNDIFITKYYKYWNKTWINWLSRGILEVWVRINEFKHKLLTNLKYRQEIDGEMKSVSGACGQSPHQQLHHSQRMATGIRMKNYSEFVNNGLKLPKSGKGLTSKNSVNRVNSKKDKCICNRTYHKSLLNSKDRRLLNVVNKKLVSSITHRKKTISKRIYCLSGTQRLGECTAFFN